MLSDYFSQKIVQYLKSSSKNEILLIYFTSVQKAFVHITNLKFASLVQSYNLYNTLPLCLHLQQNIQPMIS